MVGMDQPPIEQAEDVGGKLPDGTPIQNTWWRCPNCGAELDFSPAHDVYTEGFAPEARPDQWRCGDCGYRWAE